MGCGVGGPAKNIARYSGAEITGLNFNEYQIKKATKLTAEANLQHLIKYDEVCVCSVISKEVAYIFPCRVILIMLHMMIIALMQCMLLRPLVTHTVERRHMERHLGSLSLVACLECMNGQ